MLELMSSENRSRKSRITYGKGRLGDGFGRGDDGGKSEKGELHFE